MIKVITYGTYDLLHYGHIRLLERAKALGDYLIVGVTADAFDKNRGKINVQQSLMERVEAVRMTGLADEIIVEEYEGQKIDDIRRYDIDIFTVGSDWIGKFDYLNEYCKVVYLERTDGVSSSEIRTQEREVRLGLVGEQDVLLKFDHECQVVNGATVAGICTKRTDNLLKEFCDCECITSDYDELLEKVDAVYLISHPKKHYNQIKKALMQGKHVLCESPLAMEKEQVDELFKLAKDKHLVLMEGIKTAYSTAYYRLLLLIKSGVIGEVVSVDSTCTSLQRNFCENTCSDDELWNSICEWGTIAMLPVFQILGTEYCKKSIVSKMDGNNNKYDLFSRVSFVYPNAVASIKAGKGVKSEGELIVAGTKGYIYVPAPWWKTDYFEVRYENPQNNRRYFYQLDGEGIRYEIVAFVKAIQTGKNTSYIEDVVSKKIAEVISDFNNGIDLMLI